MDSCPSKSKLDFAKKFSFLQLLLPCEDNLLRNITCERPAFRVGKYDSLPCDMERSFRELLELEIDLFRRLECLRKDLESR